MGDSGKLLFYELDHELKMQLLKTHFHTSNRLTMEPETRGESSRKKRRPYNQANATIQKPAACRRCGEGGQKGSTANQPQERYNKRALVDIERNTGANTREKLCEPPPAGHRHSGA